MIDDMSRPGSLFYSPCILSGITDRHLGVSEQPSKKRRLFEEHDKKGFLIPLPATRDLGTNSPGLRETRSMIKAECEELIRLTVCNIFTSIDHDEFTHIFYQDQSQVWLMSSHR